MINRQAALLRGACVVEGSGKNAGAVKSSPIFGVPLAQQPALQLIDPAARAHSPCPAGQHRPDGGGYRRADDASFPPGDRAASPPR